MGSPRAKVSDACELCRVGNGGARRLQDAGRGRLPYSKPCNLVTVIAFAREIQRLRINAFEPGFTPNTGLGREANVFLRFLAATSLPKNR